MPTVVSTSAKPRAAASAASAARRAGFSFRFVTCAWFAGRRRARSFLRANISSTGSSIATTRASRAGVSPRESRTRSSRGTSTSTSRRANSSSVSSAASAAASRSRPCCARKWSMTSNSSTPRPSIRVTRPSSTASSGSGSFGPSSATRPSSGHGETSTSLRSSRASRATNRSDLRGTSLIECQQPALQVDRERLPNERRRARRLELTLEPLREGGARVAVFDQQEADGDVLAIQGDVSRAADAGSAVTRVVEELGRLDVLVNSAGIPGQSLRTLDVADEEWERVFATNAHGTFWFCRAAAQVMVERRYGRIVNVASIAGKEGNPQAAAYSGSKAAVIGFTKSIGKDLAGTGVLVNCIAPAVVQTPILEGITQEHIDYMVERIPLGRLGRPDEVAALICWLASEEMSFSTGACYDISGGRAVY